MLHSVLQACVKAGRFSFAAAPLLSLKEPSVRRGGIGAFWWSWHCLLYLGPIISSWSCGLFLKSVLLCPPFAETPKGDQPSSCHGVWLCPAACACVPDAAAGGGCYLFFLLAFGPTPPSFWRTSFLWGCSLTRSHTACGVVFPVSDRR